ncbi:Potassium channel domain-containing protein [Caenorhabditis elegans]|uniref:Potassium channel domain-containing protein n=1 Tax=Caenorhabditis elegans TaxID=6239 RepID=G5EGD4_CAEEL|nr:Potassium channel domain-containing protein [Caenorhabditis elegans]CAB05769.3 Potassium channel domain-containing protein [Caenorhabditis elegans]|eukprot:NP_506906.3 TWiK family of potassium channels [Caenorhabditis elegans]
MITAKVTIPTRNGPANSHQAVLEEIDEEEDGGVKPENPEPPVNNVAPAEESQEPKLTPLEERERKKNRVHPTMQNLPLSRSNSSTSLSKVEAVEKYYERNAHTVSGFQRNQDTFGQLQRRYKPRQDAISVLSSPGALGEPVMPTDRHFDRSMYWFAFHRKQIGLRHIMVALMVLSYTIFGAFMFWTVESRNERAVTLERVTNLENLLNILATNITEIVNNPNTTTTEAEMQVYIREAYVSLMKLEGQYKGSTYYKLEDHGKNWKWTFESAFFFSMNVYTTTGYGSIAPESILGQVLVCLYGFIFVPVTLVALRDLGQFFLVHLTKLYAQLIQRWREINGDTSIDVNEIIKIPIKACLLLLALYLAFCTIFIHVFDELSGDESGSGMSVFLCFYFSFISLSTIGLGDIMPNNATFSPIISIMFFFGMALTKVVNRNTFIAVENGIFGALTLVENKLDGIVRKGKEMPDEQKQPKALTPQMIQRALSVEDYGAAQRENKNEVMNNFTVRSIATFMKSNTDIYGGGFGRVQLRRGDLMGSDHQMTTSSEKTSTSHHPESQV